MGSCGITNVLGLFKGVASRIQARTTRTDLRYILMAGCVGFYYIAGFLYSLIESFFPGAGSVDFYPSAVPAALAVSRYDLNGVFTLFFAVAGILLAGVAIDLVFAFGLDWKKHTLGSDAKVVWSFKDIIRAVIIFLFIEIGFLALENWIGFFNLRLPVAVSNVLTACEVLLPDLVIIGFIVVRLRHYRGVSMRWLMFSRLKLKSLFFAFFAYLGFLPIMVLSVVVAAVVLFYFGLSPQAHPLTQVLLGEHSAFTTVVLVVFAVFIAPFCEELFFRAVLYRYLKKRCSMVPALVVTSLLFALAHGNVMQVVPIFMVGMALGLIYERTGSIFAPMVFHAMNNAVSVGAVFLLGNIYSGQAVGVLW